MVPIAGMTAMLDKCVVVMAVVEPTLVVMVIGQSATGTDGDEETSQD